MRYCLLLLLLGCASSSKVEQKLVDALPVEGRRWTYAAENEVIIALDRLDAARDDVALLEKRRDELKPSKAKEIATAREAWVEAELEQAKAHAEEQEQGVECAYQSLEMTKARAAVRFNLPVPEGYAKAFEERYQDCKETLDERTKEVETLKGNVQKKRESWRAARDSYAKRTGDYDHGLWIE